jgi:type IV fimbrial biogenesis protein FimT/type IV fimbrial biogenesis protein FimU
MQLTNLIHKPEPKAMVNSSQVSFARNWQTFKKPKFKLAGFTLIEAMVTIAIAGIAIAIAIPGLSSFTLQMRVDNEVSEIQRLLMTTRNAAINSGVQATLCPLAADDSCAAVNNWAGRIGVVSSDGLIKEREAIEQGDELQFAFNQVVYNPSGQLANNNIGVFSYCPQGKDEFSRAVILALSGRSHLSSDINSDGRDQDRNNNNISCD